jgi:hypothetical protein
MSKSYLIISFILFLFISLSACKQGDPIIDNNENNNSTNATLEWTKTLALPINPSISKNYMPAIDEIIIYMFY